MISHVTSKAELFKDNRKGFEIEKKIEAEKLD